MDQLAYLIELVEEQNSMIYDLQRQVAYLTDALVEEDDDDTEE
jgi:hypothetical protein